MKIRSGFVSNSSSSSFVVSKAALSETQLLMIRHHIEMAEFLTKLGISHGVYTDKHDEWQIEEKGEQVFGSTSMDNFDMGWLLDQIGVPAHAVFWGER